MVRDWLGGLGSEWFMLSVVWTSGTIHTLIPLLTSPSMDHVKKHGQPLDLSSFLEQNRNWRRIMTTYGERLTDAELDLVLQ